MYLWKYWRESRVPFSVTVLGIAIFFALIFRAQAHFAVNGQNLQFTQLPSILPLILIVQVFPVCFIAWVYGSFGIGRDLGDKSGSFLFTRPRSRSFVWHDWGFGMTQLLVIIVLLNLVIGFLLHQLLVAAGDPLHGSLLLANRPVSLATIVCLNIGCVLLLAGLVFSVTYFSTILVRHGKGVMLGAGIVLGYIILKSIAGHYWPDLTLPDLVLGAFSPSHHGAMDITDRLGISMALRAVFILLFPLAAHFVLEKTDL